MFRHKHYQALCAFANGWRIEGNGIDVSSEDGAWTELKYPSFFEDKRYRIIPDEEGWLPWYAHDDAVCPCDGRVDVKYKSGDQGYFSNATHGALWWQNEEVTHYRPHKMTKRERIQAEVENHCQCYNMIEMMDKIMAIVEDETQ